MEVYTYDEAIEYLRKKGETRDQARDVLREARDPYGCQLYSHNVFYDALRRVYEISDGDAVKPLPNETHCHDFCGDECETGCVNIDRPTLDRMFHLYSKYGDSHDFTTVCAILGIDRKEGMRIKRLAGLRKDSLPFAPHRLAELTDKEVLDAVSDSRDARLRRRTQSHHIRRLEGRVVDDERLAAFVDARLQNVKPLRLTDVDVDVDESWPTVFIATHDLHFGKVGDKMSENEWLGTMVRLQGDIHRRLQDQKIKEVVVTFGSDAFNIDNTNHTTTKGTKQDATRSLGDIADTYIHWFVGLIECLVVATPVKVQVVQGNHDRSLAIVAGKMLKHIFHGRVEVDDGDEIRKYHACGTTLVATHHGDIRTRNLPSVAYSEGAKIYGQPFERLIVMQGHLHGFALKTDGSVQTTTATSAGNRSKWETDHFGDSDDRRLAIYYVPDDDYISKVEFLRG